MQKSNNQGTKNSNQQMDLCHNVFVLSVDMVQKLTQNNLEYSKTILNNSLKLMQPISNEGKQDFLTPLQNVLTETVQDNNNLYQKAQKIITDTTDKINTAVWDQQQILGISKFNLFTLWRDLSPSVADMFRTLNIGGIDKVVKIKNSIAKLN